jgi:2-haloacid dehalogenase
MACIAACSTASSPASKSRMLPEDVLQDLNLVWHRLDAWPDVPDGLARLRSRFLVARVSNANISLMVDLQRRNNLQFDTVLGAEIASDYKPKPRVYLAAAEAFDLAPRECMMVSAAAHSSDILGAGAAGLRNATLGRPDEFVPGTAVTVPKENVDIVAKDLHDLADRLGSS